MDFMKVFDQTVREIKREVNLKVLKVPEIEQKVLDATDDEPWGPHGTVLAEIAQASKKYSECQMIMNVLWTRLAETGKNWRLVYKALTVIEYLVANGSERAVDDIVEHTYQISSLGSFEYVEPSGKDVGLNVRKKAETIAALLNDKDKIQAARDKAAATREKYVGLSSSGITYKSGAASFSGSNFKSNDRYGGFGNTGDSITFSGSYKNQYGDDKYVKTTKSKKETSRYDRKVQDSPKAGASKTSSKIIKTDKSASISSQDAPSSKYDDDFDDFDPRGTLSSKPSGGSNQVDLFGQNFVDLFDAPLPPPTDNSTSSVNNSSGVNLFAKSSEVDLFANSSEVDLFSKSSEVDLFANSSEPKCGTSTVPQDNVDLFANSSEVDLFSKSSEVDLFANSSEPTCGTSTVPQTNVDLFASQPASTVDFFAAPDPVPQPDNEASKSDTTSSTFDPFAAVPMNNFDGSMTDSSPIVSGKNSPKDQSDEKINGSSIETITPPKNETFQFKSGIWADSLSRGLIDLNITAPTKVNLANIGIVGGLTDGSEEKDKGYLAAFHANQAMGIGSGAGKYGSVSRSTSAPVKIDDDDFFSSLSMQHHQPGGFQK